MVRSSRANVELALDEVPGQGVEQLRVGRRVGQREVVHRIDDADAEIVAPDAVGEGCGRRTGCPAARIQSNRAWRGSLPALTRDLRAAQRLGVSGLPVSGSGSAPPLPPLPPAPQRCRLHGSVQIWFFLRSLFFLRSAFSSSNAFLDSGETPKLTAREDVGVGAVVDLGPAVEGVLVALGALDADAEKSGRRLLAPLIDRHRLLPPPEQVERRFVGVGVGPALVGVVLQSACTA